MAYEVSNKKHVYFVTNTINGNVLAKFDGSDGKDPKAEAITEAKKLAEEEKAWRN